MTSSIKKDLAVALLNIGAIKFGQFRLKLHEKNPDAPLSPMYIDLRVLRSFPDALDSAVEVYKELIDGLEFDCYADVPTAATPTVAVLSHLTRVPMITPRKDDKSYGSGQRIDGSFKAGQCAIAIDDLITHAESKLEAISVLEENGLKVRDLAVLIDREQGGVRELEKRGYKCHAAFGLKGLLDFYLDEGKIDQDLYDRTVQYMAQDPG